MATYLEGVQSYIPALQPYQPNISLIANVLEKRQSQYDTNFKAINDIYGKYFYADLSREDNLKRKDAMLKQIDLDLKRISGLDLSLSQNANQALQVFKPFYEDSYLMKDMATTKNYKSRRATAEGLKNSSDKDKQSQYWGTGVKAMDYQMEEFKAMPLEQTLGFQDPTYTPYKNPTEYFAKLAKDADLSIDITRMSPDGMYFMRKKNGELLIDPLSTLFSSAVANDPMLQQVYATQAYVDRKDNMYANKDKYGGLEAAERVYLTDEYNKLQKFNQEFSEKSEANLAQKKSLQNQVNKSYSDNTYSERTDGAAQRLDESVNANQAIANQAKDLNEKMSDGNSSSSVTTNGVNADLNDIQTLRSKVDYARAVQLMSTDINASVSSLMNKDRVEDIEVNPVGLENLRHGHRLGEMKTKFGYDMQKMQYKAQLDWHAYSTKKLVENGVLEIDPQTGQANYSEAYKSTLVAKDKDGNFEELEDGTALKVNKDYISKQSIESAPVVNQMLQFFKTQLQMEREENGTGNTNDVWGAFFGDYGKKRGIEGLIADMKRDPTGTMQKIDVKRAYSSFKSAVSSGVYKGIPDAENIVRSEGFNKLDDYAGLLDEMDKADVRNTETARKGMARGVNIKSAAYVDEPFYRLNANDIDAASMFTDKELSELNTRLSKLMMHNVTAGPVSQQQFYKNVAADKTKLSNGQTAAQMLQDLNASRSRNDPAGGPVYAGVLTGFYKGNTPEDITKVLYDQYKATWDTQKGSMKFDAVVPAQMIPGAKGGIFSLKSDTRTGKTILPKAYGTPNRTLWNQTMTDIRGINFNDANNKISFTGTGKGAKNESAKGLQILDAINSQVLKGDGPMFEVWQSQLAGNDATKGAMIIKPTVKQLQDLGLVGGTEDDPKTLTNAEAALVAQNGISIISDRGNFQNWLFKDAMITPGEARMNLAGANGVRYDDPLGNGYYHTTPVYGSDNNIISYNITGKFKQLNPNTGQEEWGEIMRPNVPLGGEIDNAWSGLQDGLSTLGKQNDKIYRNFNPKK